MAGTTDGDVVGDVVGVIVDVRDCFWRVRFELREATTCTAAANWRAQKKKKH